VDGLSSRDLLHFFKVVGDDLLLFAYPDFSLCFRHAGVVMGGLELEVVEASAEEKCAGSERRSWVYVDCVFSAGKAGMETDVGYLLVRLSCVGGLGK